MRPRRQDEAKCVWGDPSATHTVVMVGNSISMTYVLALATAIGVDSGWRVISWGMFGCPFTVWTVDNIAQVTKRPAGCDQRPDDAVDAINAIALEMVMVSGLSSEAGAAAELNKITTNPRILFMQGPPKGANPRKA
jgi:kynureninase